MPIPSWEQLQQGSKVGHLGSLAESAIPELILATTNRDSELQATVGWALGEIGDATPETIAALRSLGASDVGFVRDAGTDALAELSAEPSSENVVASRSPPSPL